MDTCPHCHQPIAADPLQAKVAELRATCVVRNICVSWDGWVREGDAADILGLSRFTLRNKRLAEQPLAYRKLGRTPEYQLAALADYILASEVQSY